MTTSDYGEEISWTLGNCTSGQTYGNDQSYEEDCCLHPGTYTLTCEDSYGDGWNGAYIEIKGTQYCDDFDGFEETAQIIVTGMY